MKRIIVVLTLILIFTVSGPMNIFALDGLDDYVALNLIGTAGETDAASGTDAAADNTAPAEPAQAEQVMEASQYSFAEALAQEYRSSEGSFSLTPECRLYIAVKEEIMDEPSADEHNFTEESAETLPPDDLMNTVRLMDSQLASYGIPTEQPLPVVYGEPEFSKEGDIIINLVKPADFHGGIGSANLNENYSLAIDEKNIYIDACDTDGIWYGLIELLEIAKEQKDLQAVQSPETAGTVQLACCRINDGPDLAERALMLDCGRKYYSKEWIENLIKRASLQRYNTIILHFAEAEGIRLDSPQFSWMTEDIDSLTTAEMREITEVARQYHMDVIPSFDTPGHNTFMVEKYAKYVAAHPEFSFTYNGKTYDSSINGFGSIANHYSYGGETESVNYIGIDLTQEHAVAFTNALIDSYADFFRDLGCKKIDIGSDELLGWYTFVLGGELIDYDNRWVALEHWSEYAQNNLGIEGGSASDVLISYINDLAGRLEAKGYTCRVFNDEIDINPDQHVELKDSVEITYWFDEDNTAGHFAEKGHVVYNFMESWCFYVLREEKGKDIMTNKYKTVNGENIFENWDPRSFARKAGKKMSVPDDKLGGGYFAIWCDYPDYKDAGTVWTETEMKTWANASRMWNCEVNSAESGIKAAVEYEMMKAFAVSINGFPGFTGDPVSAAKLPASPEPESGITWLQRLFS